MITHDEKLAQMADRIVRIEDGKLVNKGGEPC
jgi:putative ABC transport system ATP-binding protein